MENKSLTALEIDAATGTETIRELTADEIAEREAMALEAAQREAEAQAKAEKKAIILEALAQTIGFTPEEISEAINANN